MVRASLGTKGHWNVPAQAMADVFRAKFPGLKARDKVTLSTTARCFSWSSRCATLRTPTTYPSSILPARSLALAFAWRCPESSHINFKWTCTATMANGKQTPTI